MQVPASQLKVGDVIAFYHILNDRTYSMIKSIEVINDEVLSFEFVDFIGKRRTRKNIQYDKIS